ncbi:MAG TPA: ABC transporter permease [Acetobacteraceae bacterium]|nr:ABC transporter permease [Acetobacteraceae bacterium]
MKSTEATVLGLRPGAVRQLPQPARHDQHVWETTSDRTTSALRDVASAFRRWPLWVRLGWQDVLLRYRRSLLGPFWLTLSMGIMIATLGSIYGDILHLPTQKYLPFLATGLIVWSLVSALVNEGCQTYIESDWLIRQIDLPLAMFPIRVVWRNSIVFLHHLVIYFLILALLPIQLRWTALTAIPALLALLVNGLWFGTLFGMLSARFRDLPQIVSSVLTIVFFATPIIWSTEATTGDPLLWTLNPFYHLIEIVRAPLLGFRVPVQSWVAVLGIMVAGWITTIVAFRQLHRRISYWV